MTRPEDVAPELWQRIERYADGTLGATETRQLEEELRQNPAALEQFVLYMELHARIAWESRALGDTDNRPAQHDVTKPNAEGLMQRALARVTRPTPLSLTIATLVICLLLTAMAFMAAPFYRALTSNEDDNGPGQYDIVAEVTGLYDVRWHDANGGFHRGAFLVPGSQLSLNQGLVEVTYRSGAVVVLKGPAVLVVQEEKLGELQRGELTANVPPAAKGFRIFTPVARIEDLGTEFGVRVAADGATDVDVFEGRVVAETVDRQGDVIGRHELTKDAALSVSADAQIVNRRPAQRDEFVTALPARPLRIDFQHSRNCRTQRGFLPFTEADAASGKTYPSSFGPIHVRISGQDAERGGFFGRQQIENEGSFGYADLYDDFVFKNGPRDGGGSPQSMTLTLSGRGISPGADYELTFYSYDPDSTQGHHSVLFRSDADVMGPLSYEAGAKLTSNQKFSVTGTFTSDQQGVLSIEISDEFSSATVRTGIRVNALEIVPAGSQK